ncbi:MAG: 2-amino-4-hydroxy-6-hydroxymethyldihydropteridine diphosphokinase [Pseudomonadota bacterium]
MLHIIALGANLGRSMGANARKVVAMAHRLTAGGRIGRASRVYRTPAWPPAAGPDYANAVVVVEAPVSPEAMLVRLHGIEAAAGRIRGVRWEARILDLDLLASGALVRHLPTIQRAWTALPAEDQMAQVPDRLILPHPRLADRAFVLVPLCDVAPGWRHPLTGRTVLAMRDALPADMRRVIRALPVPA